MQPLWSGCASGYAHSSSSPGLQTPPHSQGNPQTCAPALLADRTPKGLREHCLLLTEFENKYIQQWTPKNTIEEKRQFQAACECQVAGPLECLANATEPPQPGYTTGSPAPSSHNSSSEGNHGWFYQMQPVQGLFMTHLQCHLPGPGHHSWNTPLSDDFLTPKPHLTTPC